MASGRFVPALSRSSYGDFSDPEAMARAMAHIPAWSSNPRPLAEPARNFHATMANATFDVFSIGIGGYSASIPYAGTTADQHTFMFPTLPGTVRRVSGWELFGRHIFHLRAGERMVASSARGAPWASGVLAISVEQLRARAIDLTGADHGVPHDADRLFLVPAPAMARLVGLTNDLMRLIRDTPWVLDAAEPASALSDSILDALLACLDRGRAKPDRAALGRHRVIVARFQRVLEERPEEVLSLGAICRAVGVAERTLNLACQEFLGESATRFARGRRLDHVRVRLLASDPATTRVTDVAMQLGFWELGRFAHAYHSRFGERPSETLRRQRK